MNQTRTFFIIAGGTLLLLGVPAFANPDPLAKRDPFAERDSLARATLPPKVWATRDSILAWLKGGKDLTIKKSSGRFGLWAFDAQVDRAFLACRLTVRGVLRKVPGLGQGSSLPMMLQSHLQATGWTLDYRCGIYDSQWDSLDFGMRRGGVFCSVWAGREVYDGDTTYVSTGVYWVTIDCLVDDPNLCPTAKEIKM